MAVSRSWTMGTLCLVLLVVISGAKGLGASSLNATVQLDHFCRRFEHRTAVLNNRLYVDGGYVNINSLSLDPTNYTNAALFSSDLLALSEEMPTMKATFSKNDSIPSVAGGILWADEINDVLYAFGGYFPSSSPVEFTTWSYGSRNDSWRVVNTHGGIEYVAHGMGTVAPEAGVGYYLGGYQDNQTQKGWTGNRRYTSDLVAFDMVGRSYVNSSGPDENGRGEGAMVFLPASTSGLLISFGGVTQKPSTGEITGTPMSEISIYDIEGRKWYTQNATGSIPDERTRFCAGVTWPDDKSSFNIYLYGGLRPNGESVNGSTAFDDVYILSIPGFVWIKWYPSAVGLAFPHHSTTCNVINGTQMIVMGGTFPNINSCDIPSTYGQHSLNLGQNNPRGALWTSFELNFPPYTLPAAITSLIGGTAKGGSNVTQPLSGVISYDWYLFQRRYSVPARSPTSTAKPSPEVKSSKTRATLIGVVVGAVIGGFLLGAGAIYALVMRQRRRRKAQAQKQAIEYYRMAQPAKQPSSESHVELDGRNEWELPNEQTSAREMWHPPSELPGFSERLK